MAGHYVANQTEAAAIGVLAGTDMDCGDTYKNGNDAFHMDASLLLDQNRRQEMLLLIRRKLPAYDFPESPSVYICHGTTVWRGNIIVVYGYSTAWNVHSCVFVGVRLEGMSEKRALEGTCTVF